jgi:hemoglobin/transferrin/lactoferrin receptor protein
LLLSISFAAVMGVSASEAALVQATAQAAESIVIKGEVVDEPRVDADGFSNRADQRATFDEHDLRRDGVETLQDLGKYDPRLTIVTDPERGGVGDIRMRGLGGNRIQVTLDGVPLGDAEAGRDYVDPLLLGRVTAVFGPGSSRYGSDAVAGSVRFESLQAADYVDGSLPMYGMVRGAFSANDRGVSGHGRYAYATDSSAFLIAGTTSHRHEREAPGEAVIPEQEIDTISGLLNGHSDWQDQARFGLTVDAFDQNIDSIYADNFVESRTGADNYRRARISLNQTWGDPADPWLRLEGFAQRLTSLETTTREDFRLADGAFNRRIYAQNDYSQNIFGGRLQGLLPLADQNDVIIGVNGQFTQTKDLQTSVTTTQTPAQSSPGDATRSYPFTDAFTGGLYAEWYRVFGDAWAFELGARWDVYWLDVTVDEAYERSLAGQNTPTDLQDNAPTARIAFTWIPDDIYSTYLKVATGYRNGRYDEANEAFTNFSVGYTLAPNPDLEPERSLGVEWGVQRSGNHAVELTTHVTWYRDFIESQFTGVVPNIPGVGPHETLAQYQPVNLERVVIYGIDLVGASQFGQNWALRYGISWVDGEDLDTNENIRELSPISGSLGLAWQNETGLRLEGLMRAAGEKDDVADPGAFIPSAYAVFDFRLIYHSNDFLRIDAAVENIFDTLYWQWENVDAARQENSQAANDYHAEDTRSVSVAFTLTF